MNIDKLSEEWRRRLNPERFRGTSATSTPSGWNPFDSDYSRISMSAPFRRLQDKAQVFPLEPNDFVRTRLTHSLEVSSVARSLGVRVENWLIQKRFIEQDKRGHIPSILAAASLAHDIGNPPFGHFGEKCLQEFFRKKIDHLPVENDHERADLINFDGNVQGFRLLLRLGLAADEFSYNLTFPTLATIVKYPRDSISGNKRDEKNISSKKYGFYQTDKQKYSQISDNLNLKNERHPLCFLMESADDICYSASDIEDGFKKNTIDLGFLINKLQENFLDDHECNELHDLIINRKEKYKRYQNSKSLIIQDCRIFAQQKMINSAFDSFVSNHEQILEGNFHDELLASSPSFQLRKFFECISFNNFQHETVVKSELLGETVLTYLLNRLFDAVFAPDFDNNKTVHGKIYSLLSHQSKYAMKKTSYDNKEYLKILMIIDFVASMTDTYALSLYQELCGFK